MLANVRRVSLDTLELEGKNDDLDFISNQIILMSLFRDKNIVIRDDFDKQMRQVNFDIQNFIKSNDSFLVKDVIRDIADQYRDGKISNISEATDQAIVAILLGDTEFNRKGNPRDVFLRIKQDIITTIKIYKTKDPTNMPEIPVKLYQDLGIDIYSYTVTDRWFKKKERFDQEQFNGMIKKIANRYTIKKNVKDELINRLTQQKDFDFVKRLYNIKQESEFNETIDSWLDIEGDVTNLFDEVKTESTFDKQDFKDFKKEYFKKEVKEPRYKNFRDGYAKNMMKLFNDYGNPSNYKLDKPINEKYVRNTLLPFIMYFFRGKDKTETDAYRGYIYNLITNQYKLQKKDFPDYIRSYVGKYMAQNAY